MSRDYGKEIDSINTQLDEIKDMLAKLSTQPQYNTSQKPLKNITQLQKLHPDKRLSDLLNEACEKIDVEGSSGYITYLGSFASGNRQSIWVSHQVDADKLLKLIESNIAAKALACIGNNDRLNMLLALLRAPKTAAQLVDACGYNTTGQVYHHLKPLLAADLVKEDEHIRGSYAIQPHRIQGVIMLLAGISDMLDTKYTQGNWDA